MRKLEDQINVNAPDVNYPKGSTRDKTESVPGTTVTNGLIGDIIQAFQKLVIESSITENTLPDNVTNGYQLVTALFENMGIPEWLPLSSQVDFSNIKFITYNGELFRHLTSNNSNSAPWNDPVNWEKIGKLDGGKFFFEGYSSGLSTGAGAYTAAEDITIDGESYIRQNNKVVTGYIKFTADQLLRSIVGNIRTEAGITLPPHTIRGAIHSVNSGGGTESFNYTIDTSGQIRTPAGENSPLPGDVNILNFTYIID